MIEREGYSGLGIFVAFLGGALAGATAALLLAPSTGEETRGKIKSLAANSKDKVARVPKALKSAYEQASEVAKDAFSEAYQEKETERRIT